MMGGDERLEAFGGVNGVCVGGFGGIEWVWGVEKNFPVLGL